MSFSSRILSFSGPSGKLTSAGGEYTQTYTCVVTDPLDGPITIWNYFKLNGPYFGTYYANGNDTDTLSYVDSLDTPKHVSGSALHWTIDIHYKPLTANSGTRPDIDNAPTAIPWNWKPEINTDFSQHQAPVYKSRYIDGFTHSPQVITPNSEIVPQNSSFEVFDPPLEKDESRQVIRIRSWELIFSTKHAREFIDCVNSFKLKIAPEFLRVVPFGFSGIYGEWDAHTLKVANIQETMKRDSFEVSGTRYTLEYFEINTELHWRKDGWREFVPDRGIHRAVSAGGEDGRGGTFSNTDFPVGVPKIAAILDANLHPITHPVPLNGAGQPAAPGAATVYLEWANYEEKDISDCIHIGVALTPF